MAKISDFHSNTGQTNEGTKPPVYVGYSHLPPTPQSASFTDIHESVQLSPSQRRSALAFTKGKILEGRNSAPEMMRDVGTKRGPLLQPNRRLSAAATAKQKHGTRFQT